MKKPVFNYRFTDDEGSFAAKNSDQFGPVYFPLVNDAGLLSSISPRLQGDIKLDQHSFFNIPVSIEDLHLSRASRNFWFTLAPSRKGEAATCWSVAGQSPAQRALGVGVEESDIEAGLLWHQCRRANKTVGLETRTLNFVPAPGKITSGGPFEVMMVEVKNVSKKAIKMTATSAIPLFGRSADNLRDHRHVTSLLNRVRKETYGLCLTPTMSFNERGHRLNETSYYVVGVDGEGEAPVGLFPTVDSFVGDGGDLERPAAILSQTAPFHEVLREHQGKEAIGALQFKPLTLKPGDSTEFILLLGIDPEEGSHDDLIESLNSRKKVLACLEETKENWREKASRLVFKTGDDTFNQWIRWVGIQPVLRKLFGCSFLPDFDYGRGGRGWRDLWQDCLALLLADPLEVRSDIIGNFAGVRIDGSNATVIGKRASHHIAHSADGTNHVVQFPEFKADRNNLVRTWMDHGVWPFLTTQLYLNQTGDWSLLLEKVPFFRDAQIHRGRKQDAAWLESQKGAEASNEPLQLKSADGKIYNGTVLEHILVQLLVQFFNVGEHNNIRLEDADWNDGLDMAPERGESVAFTALYAGNLDALADVLETGRERFGWTEFSVAEEILLLVDRAGKRVDYGAVSEKNRRLKDYFEVVSASLSGKQASLPVAILVSDLREKARSMKDHLNQNEWLEEKPAGWFNGYYDNKGARVEGIGPDGKTRMTLTGQVFQIMSGVASPERISKIIKAVDSYLWDRELGGLRLNTNFGSLQPDLGRAFSFAYGEKENGAVFSHMVVMYANALYQKGFVADGHRVFESLYKLAVDAEKSRIFPGLPEYFNNEGRGRYAYLTGSASWYILTMLTHVFGLRGDAGDLLIAPKLVPSQFNSSGEATVQTQFAGATLTVVYQNKAGVPNSDLVIKDVRSGDSDIPFTRRSPCEALIQREILSQKKEWNIVVELVKKGRAS